MIMLLSHRKVFLSVWSRGKKSWIKFSFSRKLNGKSYDNQSNQNHCLIIKYLYFPFPFSRSCLFPLPNGQVKIHLNLLTYWKLKIITNLRCLKKTLGTKLAYQCLSTVTQKSNIAWKENFRTYFMHSIRVFKKTVFKKLKFEFLV